MSQEKQQPSALPNAPKSSPPQCPTPCLTTCSTSSGISCPAGCSSQRQGLQNPAGRRRLHHPQPRCLSGGTTYHCKEEEC
ncbi:late cornified envelope protein 6A [Meriones unguiculatus]|uniref:late cornified envelope protein 6A n=1 Tax=Meriones unguiculatus TaxID=10047 RepID=UPI000B4EF17F|nr:late cornified envelope protein 6A [Meriones unguiculatus]XP_021483237.1 late cornified envelope protein 6A [Meriones unguiculatus]